MSSEHPCIYMYTSIVFLPLGPLILRPRYSFTNLSFVSSALNGTKFSSNVLFTGLPVPPSISKFHPSSIFPNTTLLNAVAKCRPGQACFPDPKISQLGLSILVISCPRTPSSLSRQYRHGSNISGFGYTLALVFLINAARWSPGRAVVPSLNVYGFWATRKTETVEVCQREQVARD